MVAVATNTGIDGIIKVMDGVITVIDRGRKLGVAQPSYVLLVNLSLEGDKWPGDLYEEGRGH